MPAVVECECGRRFRAKDELRGRTIACPGCGASLTVPLAAVPVPSTLPRSGPKPSASGAMGYPGQRNHAHPGNNRDNPRFSVSGKQIIFLSLFILIPTIIYLGKIGPVAAMNRWRDGVATYDSDITDTHNRFMYQYLEKQGLDLTQVQNVPKVTNVMIDEPIMMFRFPKSVPYQGQTSEGHFYGVYTFDTHHLKGTIEMSGQTLPIDATVDNGKVIFR